MSKLGLRGVNGPALVFWLQNQVLNLGCVCVCVCEFQCKNKNYGKCYPLVPDTVEGPVPCSLAKSCFLLLAYRSGHRDIEA